MRDLRTIAWTAWGTLAFLVVPAHSLTFNFNPQPGMDQDAIDGFVEAGELWSVIYDDAITLNIDIDFRQLDPGVLGSTSSDRTTVDYGDFVTAVVGAATSADDTASSGSLQAGPSFDMLLNRTANSPHGSGSATPFLDDDSDANNRAVRLTRANAKALGLIAADDTGRDAFISFSSDFNWDFDPGNGITANHFNFVFVAAHEIGHMMGFTSGVDILDGNSPPVNGPFQDSLFTWVSGPDSFRFSSDSFDEGGGIIDWTADNRPKFFSIDGGATDLGEFSRGRNFGDGQQASHWKDDRGLGIMDPTVGAGEEGNITNLDIQLFDVIGYDLNGGQPVATGEADLAISSSASVNVTYTITVTNNGPDAAIGAVVSDTFPTGLSGVAWTCTATGGAACAPSGSGDILDTVDLPAGSSVTYSATGTSATFLGNAASVSVPAGVTDPDPSNDSAGDAPSGGSS